MKADHLCTASSENPANRCRKHHWWSNRTTTEKTLLPVSLCLSIMCSILLILLSADFSGRTNESDVCMTVECIQAASGMLFKMDLTVDPCQDFYQFACGNYLKRHVVPDDHYLRSTLQQMQEDVYIIVKKLIEEPINSTDSETTIKLKTLYSSCMNESFLDDSSPLTGLLTDSELGRWPILGKRRTSNTSTQSPSPLDLEGLLAKLAIYQVQPFVDFHVSTDYKNSSAYLMQLFRGRPAIEQDYYLNSSLPDSTRYMQAYEHLIISAARVLGGDIEMAKMDAGEILEFERKFANISLSKWYQDDNNMTDDDQMYNKLSIEDLQEEIPEIDWKKMLGVVFKMLHFDMDESSLLLIVHCRSYLRELVFLLQATPNRVVSNYLLWRFILKYMPFSDRELRRLYTDFRRDVPEPGDSRPFCARWKECVAIASDGMGMAVGALYVRNHRPELAEKEIGEMINALQKAFIDALPNQDWLDPETRLACEEKVQAMDRKVGYPKFILDENTLNDDYGELEVNDDRLLSNVLNMKRFEVQKELLKLKRPVNKDRDWMGSPVEVNAFYRPNFNEILFPAGILRDPIFNPKRPMYLNYGSVGVVIGHEITHGFDNDGRRFDKSGNLSHWWPEETIEKFNRKVSCFVEQYSNYQLGDSGYNINGNETLGDNICDNVGLHHAYAAYKDWVHEHHEEQRLPGLDYTPEQLFFISYAQIWCEVLGKEGYEKYTKDIHSPGQYRTIGVLSNSEAFAAAFQCPRGFPMNPEKKCHLWVQQANGDGA